MLATEVALFFPVVMTAYFILELSSIYFRSTQFPSSFSGTPVSIADNKASFGKAMSYGARYKVYY